MDVELSTHLTFTHHLWEQSVPTPQALLEAEAMKASLPQTTELAHELPVSAHSVDEMHAAREAEMARRKDWLDSIQTQSAPFDQVRFQLRGTQASAIQISSVEKLEMPGRE
jgi:hypothetical protein